jgi:hypothetical protein
VNPQKDYAYEFYKTKFKGMKKDGSGKFQLAIKEDSFSKKE